MPSVELWSAQGRERVINLDAVSYVIGRNPASADIILDDPTVSDPHAVLERVGSKWLIRDLGARNTTRVNGDPVVYQRQLRDADEIGIGRRRVVFHDGGVANRPITEVLRSAPTNISRRERDVLVELCRPRLSHNTFQTPSSVREIADRLCVGKGAVQAHLISLYDKFEIHDDGDRRIALANAAIDRGAVTRADLVQTQTDGDDSG